MSVSTSPIGGNFWKKGPTKLKCVRVIQRTPDVKSFQFIAEPVVYFDYRPGQYVQLTLRIAGNELSNSYTMSSTPTRPHLLELSIKKESSEGMAHWLHDYMKPGEILEVVGPMGQFTCYQDTQPQIVLLSAGIGITPCLSMARWLIDQGYNKEIVFFHSAKSEKHIAFKTELSLMSEEAKNFRAEISLTSEESSPAWLGHQGRLDQTLLQQICPSLSSTSVYCCGPTGFMQQVRLLLKNRDFDFNHYHEEHFVTENQPNKASKLDASSDNARIISQIPSSHDDALQSEYQLTFKSSQKSITLSHDDVILDKAEEAGVFIDYGCRAGSCGACKVKLISGNTETEVEAGLNDDDKKRGYILTCTTRIQSNVTIDV